VKIKNTILPNQKRKSLTKRDITITKSNKILHLIAQAIAIAKMINQNKLKLQKQNQTSLRISFNYLELPPRKIPTVWFKLKEFH